MTLSFVVYGIPQPQGSAKAFVVKSPASRSGMRAIVTSDNTKNKPWRKDVADAALVAIVESRWRELEGAVTLAVDFYLARPLRVKADEPHGSAPDLDKLVRSVGDALTGLAWVDDAQVDVLHARKGYAAPGTLPRAEIAVTATTGGLKW